MKLIEKIKIFYKLANNKKTMRDTLDKVEEQYNAALNFVLKNPNSLERIFNFIEEWGSDKHFKNDENKIIDLLSPLILNRSADYDTVIAPVLGANFNRKVWNKIMNKITKDYLLATDIDAHDYVNIERYSQHLYPEILKLAQNKMLKTLMDELPNEPDNRQEDDFYWNCRKLYKDAPRFRNIVEGLAKRRGLDFYLEILNTTHNIGDKLIKIWKNKIDKDQPLSVYDIAILFNNRYNRPGYAPGHFKHIFELADENARNYMSRFLYHSEGDTDYCMLTEDGKFIDLDYKIQQLAPIIYIGKLSNWPHDDEGERDKWIQMFMDHKISPL